MFTSAVWGLLVGKSGGSGDALYISLSLDKVSYDVGGTVDVLMDVVSGRAFDPWVRLGVYRKSDDSLVEMLIDAEQSISGGHNVISASYEADSTGAYYLYASVYEEEESPSPLAVGGQSGFVVTPGSIEAETGLDVLTAGILGANESPEVPAYAVMSGLDETYYRVSAGLDES